MAEIFIFMENFVCNGTSESKKSYTYKLITHILTEMESTPVELGVPYFALFGDETDYVDRVVHDYVGCSISYNELLKSFIFKDINDMFYGCKAILKKINLEVPNDVFIQDRLQTITSFLDMVHNTIAMDELCDTLKATL